MTKHCEHRRCGALPEGERAVRFRVWAPRAGTVDLALCGPGDELHLPMERLDRGYFELTRDEVRDGQRYAFRLNGDRVRPDPCSLWQPEGVHAPSAVFRPGRFAWTDAAWRGVPRDELVFYELHVGTFTTEGTFAAVIPRLAELRELGVTAIEIMPVAQFPGPRNWGYDGVYPYATQHSYGGPHELQRLVDAAHGAGLAVFLDVVYNHLGPEGNYLSEFGPYFNDRYKTPWGRAFNYDDAGSDPARDYVLDNARMWLDEFHFDGLRLDAVHAIYDFSPHHILQAIGEVAEQASARQGRPLHIVAESDLNDPRLLLARERGGYELGAQWSDDFHHVVHTLLTGEDRGYYRDYGNVDDLPRVLQSPFVYGGQYSRYRDRRHGAPAEHLSGDRFVVAIQNHDQVGNRAQGDRFGTLLSPAQQRLAASLLLLSPHLPLIFMGEEYGETNPFQFFCSFDDPGLVEAVRRGRREEFSAFGWQGEIADPHEPATFERSRLRWSWAEGTHHAGLRRLYHDLLAARKSWPALRNFDDRSAQLHGVAQSGRVLELVRGGRVVSAGRTVRALFNLAAEPQPLPMELLDHEKTLFSSALERYGGEVKSIDRTVALRPYECRVLGAQGA